MRKTWKVWTLWLAVVSMVTAQADNEKSVTAAQVNGTWKTKYGEFKIWALGKQRLQIEFSGVYEYKTPQGPSANEGVGSVIAAIEGETATFKPQGAEEECQQDSQPSLFFKRIAYELRLPSRTWNRDRRWAAFVAGARGDCLGCAF